MRLTHLGTLELAQNDARDSYPNRARSNLVDMKNGGYDLDGSEVVWDSSTVSRTYFLRGARMDEQYDSLNVMLAAGRCVGTFLLRDGRQRCCYLKITGSTPQANASDWKYRQPIQITLSRAYPFYWDYDHVQFMDMGLTMDSGLTFDDHYEEINIAGAVTTFSVPYNGTTDSRMVTLTFVPAGGSSLADILVENLTNGMSFLYEGTVLATKRLDIDNATKTVMNDSTDDFANLSFPDDKQTEIMRLKAPSGNNFRVTATLVGTAKLYLAWIGEFL
jgi:hypothetical protein